MSAGRGRGNYHYAQAGHGGANSHGNHFGDITMRAGIAADGLLQRVVMETSFSQVVAHQTTSGLTTGTMLRSATEVEAIREASVFVI